MDAINQDRAQCRFDRDEDVVEDQVANDRDKIKGKVHLCQTGTLISYSFRGVGRLGSTLRAGGVEADPHPGVAGEELARRGGP